MSKRMHLLVTFFIWLGLILFGFAGYFAVKSWIKAQAAKPRADWAQVPGEVTKSVVAQKDGDGLMLYAADICFSYNYQGIAYESKTLEGDVFFSSDQKGAQKLVAQYPSGKTVSMAVPPKNPSQAWPTTWKSSSQLFVLVGFSIAFVGLVFVAVGFYFK
jgi:Protein of unknown function (DUF3592)